MCVNTEAGLSPESAERGRFVWSYAPGTIGSVVSGGGAANDNIERQGLGRLQKMAQQLQYTVLSTVFLTANPHHSLQDYNTFIR